MDCFWLVCLRRCRRDRRKTWGDCKPPPVGRGSCCCWFSSSPRLSRRRWPCWTRQVNSAACQRKKVHRPSVQKTPRKNKTKIQNKTEKLTRTSDTPSRSGEQFNVRKMGSTRTEQKKTRRNRPLTQIPRGEKRKKKHNAASFFPSSSSFSGSLSTRCVGQRAACGRVGDLISAMSRQSPDNRGREARGGGGRGQRQPIVFHFLIPARGAKVPAHFWVWFAVSDSKASVFH